MKKIIILCALALSGISATSCGDDKQPGTAPGTPSPANNQQGKGTITLVCNGQTFVTSGNCNYSSIGSAIVIADSANNANAVTLNMEGGLPTATQTYNLMDNASGNGHISMSFTRFPAGKMYDWETKDGAGSIVLTVEGNKITCTFNNVPMDGS
ncbi:MAG: hypothetical protein JNL72_15690, partial [Flavipsychrobacter sp.]|nr:hypothetical protein [Flavipsychrobacter sp.]